MGTGKKIAVQRRANNLTQEQLAESCDYLLRDDMEDPEGQGQPYEGGETAGTKTDLVTRLLLDLRGKCVRLSFYDDVEDFDLIDEPCRMVDFDQQWVRVSYQEKKQEVEKMLPISSILAIEIIGEEL